jgi:glycosyltransferase involved in cell wall biosynthesis
LARRLAVHWRVLYVRPVSLGSARRRGPVPIVQHVTPRLSVVRPLALSPGRAPAIATLNQRLVPLQVRALGRPGSAPIHWMSHPDQLGQLGRYGERLVCFDWMDRHAAFRQGAARSRMEANERAMVVSAGLVFASSVELVELGRAWGANPRLVQNGVEFEHFSPVASAAVLEHATIRAIPRPRMLFYGTLSARIDADLVARCARAEPTWQFVIAGPSAGADLSALAPVPNVHILATWPYAELPRLLAGADVCMLPFRHDDMTRAIDPVKVYEYLAAGKPVVATTIPEIRKFGDLVSTADGVEGFLGAIREHIAHGSSATMVARRQEFARQNTWDLRADQIASALRECLAVTAR